MTTTRMRVISTALCCAVSVFLLSLMSITSVLASEFELVTMGEYTESLNAGENPNFEFIAKAVPGGPLIKVLSPLESNGTLESPVDIVVTFEPAADASIDMSSLKIYYLMFIKKDVTGRLLEHATVDGNSIRAEGAKLPSGKHKFLIEIHDSEQRVSSQKIVVKVGA